MTINTENKGKSMHIAGYVPQSERKHKSSHIDINSISVTIDLLINELVPDGGDFLTAGISQELLKRKIDPSCLSGQMSSKRTQGLLTNRKPTQQELELHGKISRVWSTTEDFKLRIARIRELQEQNEDISEVKADDE